MQAYIHKTIAIPDKGASNLLWGATRMHHSVHETFPVAHHGWHLQSRHFGPLIKLPQQHAVLQAHEEPRKMWEHEEMACGKWSLIMFSNTAPRRTRNMGSLSNTAASFAFIGPPWNVSVRLLPSLRRKK